MFETNLATTAQGRSVDGESLRVPAWDELVARLSAMRDLRAALGKSGCGAGSSFASFAAGVECEVNEKGSGINLTGLAHGKTDAAISDAAAIIAADADRETQ